MTSEATAYVLDDDDAVRRSTGMVLAAAGIGHAEYESAATFLQDFDRDTPGCLILDLHMAGMSGVELLQRLRGDGVELPVLVVTGTGTVPSAVQTMKLGVEDFLEKPVRPEQLLAKVRAALDADRRRRADVAEVTPIRERLATLTQREQELLKHVINGLPNKLIARAMSISIKTVENHRANLMDKMHATNVADLVRMKLLVQAHRKK